MTVRSTYGVGVFRPYITLNDDIPTPECDQYLTVMRCPSIWSFIQATGINMHLLGQVGAYIPSGIRAGELSWLFITMATTHSERVTSDTTDRLACD